MIKLFAHALYGPLLLAEWAPVVLLHPQGHAAEVEAVVALAPHHDAILFAVRILLTLTLAAQTGICGKEHRTDKPNQHFLYQNIFKNQED